MSVPTLGPSAIGVKVTEIVHASPAGRLLGDIGQSDVSAKFPDVEIPSIVSGIPRLFFSVMALAALVEFTN